ncbi:uncharacterized protein [Nicotiana tomentosiformis]|uniref:uncharacterized protein isoform X1 n=1 Tax=Nicotiana tomentosiformis TaxID=4098 RepID=UPI00388C9DCF
MPAEVNEAEWNFLVDYFSSDAFKQMSAQNKTNKGKQEMNHICGRKSFQAVSYDADKLTEIVAEQIQEVEEGTDIDPIVNAAFVKLVGKKSGYCRGQGSGVKPASRRSTHVT